MWEIYTGQFGKEVQHYGFFVVILSFDLAYVHVWGLTLLPCCYGNPEGISPILYRGNRKHPSDDNTGATVSLGGRIQKDSMHTTPENCLHLPRQESEL